MKQKINPVLNLLLEMGPLVIFFFVNARGESLLNALPAIPFMTQPIFLATAAFMVAMVISVTLSYILTRSIPVMPLFTGVIVLVFGGLTLYLQNDVFIKVKPTLTNGLMGGTLLLGLLMGKPLLKIVFSATVTLQEKGWCKLSLHWGIFLIFLALLNEIIWRNTSTEFWVAFKVWGVMPLTMLFALTQLPVMLKYQIQEEEAS